MGKFEDKILDQKEYNQVVLQRIYKRDMPQLTAIKGRLTERWGRNASFADAVSLLLEFYLSRSTISVSEAKRLLKED